MKNKWGLGVLLICGFSFSAEDFMQGWRLQKKFLGGPHVQLILKDQKIVYIESDNGGNERHQSLLPDKDAKLLFREIDESTSSVPKPEYGLGLEIGKCFESQDGFWKIITLTHKDEKRRGQIYQILCYLRPDIADDFSALSVR